MKKVLLVLIALLFISGCTTAGRFFGEPDLKIQEVVIEKIDSEGITFRANYLVTNPYPVGVAVARIAADAGYEGVTVVSMLADEGVVLAASEASRNNVLFMLPYTTIVELAGEGSRKDFLSFTLDGTVSFDLSTVPYLNNQELNIPFHYDFNVPVFKPRVRVSNGQLALPSVREVSSALVAGGLNMIKAGVIAGKFIIGQPVDGDVLTTADLDIGILFDLEIENRGGAPWHFELDECSIDAGYGELVVLKQDGASSRTGDSSVSLPVSAVINTTVLGRFISEVISGSLTDSVLSIAGTVSFPEGESSVGFPFRLRQTVPLGSFRLSSE